MAQRQAVRYRRPSHIAAVTVQDVVYVADVFRGPILVLEGSAALIWAAALDGDLDGLVALVAGDGTKEQTAVKEQVNAFLADLAGRGFLTADEVTREA